MLRTRMTHRSSLCISNYKLFSHNHCPGVLIISCFFLYILLSMYVYLSNIAFLYAYMKQYSLVCPFI